MDKKIIYAVAVVAILVVASVGAYFVMSKDNGGNDSPSSLDGAELKVFGRMAAIGEDGDWQHRGFGRELMRMAEERAIGSGASEIRVTSGAGVRDYYASLGYAFRAPYMAKDLTLS